MNCPLMSQSIPQKHHGSEVVWIDCIQMNCQWWTEDNCIVFAISSSLADLATEAERIRQSGRPETVQPRPRGPEPEQAAEEPII